MKICKVRPGSIDRVIEGIKRMVGDKFIYMQLYEGISQAEELIAYPIKEGAQIKLKKSTYPGTQKTERKVRLPWKEWGELLAWVRSRKREKLETKDLDFQGIRLSLSTWPDRIDMKIKKDRSSLRGGLTWEQWEKLSSWINERHP